MKKIGLALGGGAARGLAHIGVLKVLEEEGIPVNLLAGTSIGGLISCLYAAGIGAPALEEEALRVCSRRFLLPLTDTSLLRRGLFKGQTVVDYLEGHLGDRTFADLRLPTAVVAVDLLARREVVLREGRVVPAVRATIAVPGVFTPVEMDGRVLIDGGVLNNVPADVARFLGAEVLIAVNVHGDGNSLPRPQAGPHLLLPAPMRETLDILYQSLSIMMEHLVRHKLGEAAPEVTIAPALPPGLSPLLGFPTNRFGLVFIIRARIFTLLDKIVRLCVQFARMVAHLSGRAPLAGFALITGQLGALFVKTGYLLGVIDHVIQVGDNFPGGVASLVDLIGVNIVRDFLEVLLHLLQLVQRHLVHVHDAAAPHFGQQERIAFFADYEVFPLLGEPFIAGGLLGGRLFRYDIWCRHRLHFLVQFTEIFRHFISRIACRDRLHNKSNA